MNKQPFFSNQPMSLYYSLLEKIEKIRDCRQRYSQNELSLFIKTCHDLLKQYTQSDAPPEKIMALHFMQAEFLTRLSLLAIDEEKGKEAYDHYERANYALSAAAEYRYNLTEQNYCMNDKQIEEIKKSNSQGFTDPIEALDRITEIIDPQLTPLLQQMSKLSKTA